MKTRMRWRLRSRFNRIMRSQWWWWTRSRYCWRIPMGRIESWRTTTRWKNSTLTTITSPTATITLITTTITLITTTSTPTSTRITTTRRATTNLASHLPWRRNNCWPWTSVCPKWNSSVRVCYPTSKTTRRSIRIWKTTSSSSLNPSRPSSNKVRTSGSGSSRNSIMSPWTYSMPPRIFRTEYHSQMHPYSPKERKN